MPKAKKDEEKDRGEERPLARYLAEVIRKTRLAMKLTQEGLGERIGYTGSAISAVETGAAPVSDQMLESLEPVIGDERKLFELARKYLLMEKYSMRFGDFLPIEAGAHMVSCYQTFVIDGLFQTEPYARAVISGSYPQLSEDRIDFLVARRMGRKALFDREPTAMIQLIVEESVLRRPFGSWDIMREQLLSLVKDAQRSNVTVQILPLERGLTGTHAGERGPMKLVETQDHDHVVYMENEDEKTLLTDRTSVGRLAQRYAKIRAQALSPDESLGVIERLAGELQ